MLGGSMSRGGAAAAGVLVDGRRAVRLVVCAARGEAEADALAARRVDQRVVHPVVGWCEQAASQSRSSALLVDGLGAFTALAYFVPAMAGVMGAPPILLVVMVGSGFLLGVHLGYLKTWLPLVSSGSTAAVFLLGEAIFAAAAGGVVPVFPDGVRTGLTIVVFAEAPVGVGTVFGLALRCVRRWQKRACRHRRLVAPR
ncbi:hypothetical protein [Kitasatospora sp. NPDC059673]|uniref:hypothetical protein n=1 Tax=Kitasatospora sp. NPDC059673 TaxID=3346901 RepID=UPI0036CE135B